MKGQGQLFSPASLGPIRLRNRSIRSAAFEGMSPEGKPAQALIDFHRLLAEGGVGMTTVAYASVLENGRSFSHQLWMRPEIVADLRRLTDAVHVNGAAASIQLGHCGNMSDARVTGTRPWAPSAKLNLFGLSLPKAMNESEIEQLIGGFAKAAALAKDSGFDAVELHGGHGYLLSQFLSPITNRRGDRWGGSWENRCRLMLAVVRRVRSAIGGKMALLVKMNLRDAVKGGIELADAVALAQLLQQEGVDAAVLSGGFVSRTPMYVMRGDVPLKELVQAEDRWLAKVGLSLFGKFVVKAYPFEQGYFLKDALVVRKAVSLPLVLVGGLTSLDKIEQALDSGFEFVAFARALLREPDFIAKLQRGETQLSKCQPCNKCMATMYHGQSYCPEAL